MYVVYWSVMEDQPDHTAPQLRCYSELFLDDQMTESLKFMEALRACKYNNHEPIHFITLSSENPDCVGKQGVDVTGPDYDWKKRRL